MWAYDVKARGLMGLGKFEAAIDTYDEAMSRLPNNGDAHVGKVEAEICLIEKNQEKKLSDEKTEQLMLDELETTIGYALDVNPAKPDRVIEEVKET